MLHLSIIALILPKKEKEKETPSSDSDNWAAVINSFRGHQILIGRHQRQKNTNPQPQLV